MEVQRPLCSACRQGMQNRCSDRLQMVCKPLGHQPSPCSGCSWGSHHSLHGWAGLLAQLKSLGVLVRTPAAPPAIQVGDMKPLHLMWCEWSVMSRLQTFGPFLDSKRSLCFSKELKGPKVPRSWIGGSFLSPIHACVHVSPQSLSVPCTCCRWALCPCSIL